MITIKRVQTLKEGLLVNAEVQQKEMTFVFNEDTNRLSCGIVIKGRVLRMATTEEMADLAQLWTEEYGLFKTIIDSREEA